MSTEPIITHRPRKFRSALAWLLVGVLAPFLLVSTLFLTRQWELQREASLKDLHDLARLVQLSLDRELALDQTALQVLATSPAIDAQDWSAFYSAATDAAKIRPVSWVLLADRAKRSIINTYVPLGTPLPGSEDHDAPPGQRIGWEGRSLPAVDSGVLSEPMQSGRPRISNLFYGPLRKGPVVSLSLPVRRNEAVPYTVAFVYAPERFLNLIKQQPQADKVMISIIDGNGNIIAPHRDAEQSIGRVAPWPFAHDGNRSEAGILEARTLDGVPAFLAHRHSDLSEWTVAVAVSKDEVLAPARRSLLLWLALLLAMLAAAALLARRFWRRVALPLSALARQARERGTCNAQMPQSDIEEIDTLGAALDEAAKSERARREEVSRRLELEQREHLLALRHADELRAADRRKDEFLAMVGHELRNPLAPIMNAIAVLRKVANDAPTVQRLLGILDRQSRQLQRLVEDVLDLARINKGKIVLRKSRMDLRDVLEQAALAAQAGMEARRHTLEVRRGPRPIWIDGDEARLAQISGNLLDNAAKYTEPGGHIVLSATQDAGGAVLQVKDNGKGIAPDLLPHVFDLFEQGDISGVRAAGGLGIGLHVVKRLVEQHGGDIGVESGGEQRGSTFEVRLPLANQPELRTSIEELREVSCDTRRSGP